MRTITGSISTYVFSMRDRQPQFLLLLRAPGLLHAGTWQAVHGMIEQGETAYAAALREMREETGLEPDLFLRTDYIETFYSEHTDGVHLVPAFAAHVPDLPPATISEEHTDHAWLPLDDAIERLVWPSQREAMRVIAAAVTGWPRIGHGARDISVLVGLASADRG